jgi:hypothetical protein
MSWDKFIMDSYRAQIYVPMMVEFNSGPAPSLFVPNTVTTIVDNEGQAIAKDARLSTCSQTPCRQDAAGILTEAQSMPKVVVDSIKIGRSIYFF